ncbi:MAG TPA: hydroxymethylbilane synthase [Blastocatellia bacterium]|nr:hydroxymethylbilane synthase [Blastocatellia bacterium]
MSSRSNTLIIGSRGSKLALWQSNWVRDQLIKQYPETSVEIKIIKTTGDKILDVSLSKLGGRGVFTKEIEEAMTAGEIDLAVHSLKDLPTELPEGLHISAITKREDVRDALLTRNGESSIKELPQGAAVGTSSLRRQAQLRSLRPDLRLLDLRGNVDTRLKKLQEGQYDAIILAAAGLKRLGFAERISALLALDEMLPAIGQGALGIETRIDDERINSHTQFLNHLPTRYETIAERALLRALGGGCQVPIAANAISDGDALSIRALVASLDGTQVVKKEISGEASKAEDLGKSIADNLLKSGANKILEEVYSAGQAVRDEAIN